MKEIINLFTKMQRTGQENCGPMIFLSNYYYFFPKIFIQRNSTCVKTNRLKEKKKKIFFIEETYFPQNGILEKNEIRWKNHMKNLD